MAIRRFEGYSSSEQRIDPQAIRAASYLTSSAKMQRLYDLSTALLSPPAIRKTPEERSVSLTYGGWTNRSIYEATAWFTRDACAMQTSNMRSKEEGKAGSLDGNVAKKRKLRTGRQMDVGSFLGAFR
jgi:hypothetical protein